MELRSTVDWINLKRQSIFIFLIQARSVWSKLQTDTMSKIDIGTCHKRLVQSWAGDLSSEYS